MLTPPGGHPYRRAHARASDQRGVAALAMVLVMLGVMALAMLYLNRGLLVEIRSAADHRRAAAAFEAAEAGLEWATAQLNDPRLRNARCEPDATAGTSIRDRYLPSAVAPSGAADGLPSVTFVPRPADRIGCRLDDGALRCGCPAPGQLLTFDPNHGPHFTVSFASVPGDGESVQVVSRGCIGDGAACARAFEPSAAAAPLLSTLGATSAPRADALSRVQATLKLAPRLTRLPTAPLTAVGDVRLDATSLDNAAPRGDGWLVHAGGRVDAGAASASALSMSMQSIAGTPGSARLASNDTLLAARGGDAFARHLFGLPLARLSTDTGVRSISGCTPVACGDELSRLEGEGWRSFVVDGDVLLPARELGTPSSPVAILAHGTIGFAGSSVVTGLLFTAGRWQGFGPSRGRLVGAAVAAGEVDRPGLDAASYDADVLVRLRASGPLLRVPGSWSDE